MVPEASTAASLSTMTLQQFPNKAVESYGEVEFSRLDRKLAIYRALSPEDRATLPEFEQRISGIAECIEANANLLKVMAASAESIHAPANSKKSSLPNGMNPDEEEDEKQFLCAEVRRGFSLLTKDWSSLGKAEREKTYTPLITAIEEAYEEARRAMRTTSKDSFRVLVPGAGAGRLAWELVKRGYAVEGCEPSFTALLVGNFALNSTAGEGGHIFYPFVHEHSNVRKGEVAMRGIEIPDVDPKAIPSNVQFSMRAGNFTEAYDGQEQSWDAICCSLAFDLGEGVLDFVRRVGQILKTGGVWAFVGPMPCLAGGSGDGIQLSIEEVMGVIRKNGFKVMKKEQVSVMHSTDPQALRTVRLKVPVVVAIKVRHIAEG